MEKQAIANVGQIIKHKLFDYRGVVVDVDPVFMQSEEWYEQVAKTRPSKDQPWYHVLVHGSDHSTYVAQCNLEPDEAAEPIHHPALEQYFSSFEQGRYVMRVREN